MENNKSFFQAAKMPREQFQINLSITGIQADQWIDYLGPEIYCWWIKFHSWIDNSATKKYNSHVPYTLESVYDEHLKVSKANFYRKIKKLWECGLIEIAEFEFSERKSQKPKNIFVYSYPFNKAELQYKPLEKLRDWNKNYESESKKAGLKGALKRWENHGINSDTVENPVDNRPKSVDKPVENSPVDNVDNVNKHGINSDTVDGINSDTVTVSNQIPNQLINNLVNKPNKHNQLLNNSLLSQSEIDLIQESLKEFNFNAGEREKVIELINYEQIYDISKRDIILVAKRMVNNPNIINRPAYFVKGLKMSIENDELSWGKRSSTSGKLNSNSVKPKNLPFYNWLEE